MSEHPKGDDNNTDAPRDDSGHGDVLSEKKRKAMRQILTGTAAVVAVLATTNRARAVGVSTCFSFIGQDIPQGLENKPSDFAAAVALGEDEIDELDIEDPEDPEDP